MTAILGYFIVIASIFGIPARLYVWRIVYVVEK